METSDAGWRGIRVSNKSHDIVRDNNRYTGTSGNNRKSYITSHFRDSVDSSRERNTVDLRASSSARSGMARSFLSARRSKIDDVWMMPVSEAMHAPLYFPKSKLTSGRIAGINVRNSNETGKSSLHDPRDSSRKSYDEEVALSMSGLVLNDNSELSRKDLPEIVNAGISESSRPAVTWNQDFRSVVTPVGRFSFAGNDFSANRDLGRKSDDISSASKDRWISGSVKSGSISNEDGGGDTSRWKIKQFSNAPSSQTTGNVPDNFREKSAIDSIHRNRNAIRESVGRVDSTVTPHGDLKPVVIGHSPRRVGDSIQRNDLNNSEKLTTETARLTLIPNSKSEIVHRFVDSRKNGGLSNRNFVRLRRPSSTSNRWNASNILNANNRVKLKKNSNAQSAILQSRQSTKDHSTRTAARRPDVKNRTTFEVIRNRNLSLAQKPPSQVTERVQDGNETRDEYNGTYSKNWPNDALHDVEDLYNYEKYTSSLREESSHDESLSILPHVHAGDGASILSLSSGYVNRPDPVLDSSVQKIIQWLKIPTIVSNNTRFADDDSHDDVHKPIESVLESIYENLDPNRPLSDFDRNDTETVFQEAPQSQDADGVNYHEDYPTQWPSASSIVHEPQYTTDFAVPSLSTLTPSTWSDAVLLRNKTTFNPTTHVTQNTVVHILNNGLKKPNVTVTQLKTPEENSDQAAISSETSAESPSRPNVHIMFTSEKNEEQSKVPTKQETETFPSSSTHGANCPTIMINTYTRVNNTIQSKEGCTDLNIVVNSHVLNTNVFKPSGAPDKLNQPTISATENLDDTDGSDKYADNDLFHQDSSINHVTAPTSTYGLDPLETQQFGGLGGENYESQKDPVGIQDAVESVASVSSTVEVFQGTQISVVGSPLTDSSPVDPSGSSIDGPGVGDESLVADEALGVPMIQGPVSSLNDATGTVMGQSNSALGTLQLPARPNIGPGLASTLSSSHLASSGSSSNIHNDDDDDDDYDISPDGVLHSIASIFTYFSFMNPVGYSFFSLAAAPFAAMAAGVLGVAAVVFPWALPNVLDFGRAANKVTVRFSPNLEEFVRRAVHKYDRLNEWKSKRRKRRR